jgi:hypothetical protein
MNKEQIKQELHELVDGLDVNAASIDTVYIDHFFALIDGIKMLLLKHQKSKKEKTLEQKLVDANFVKLSNAVYCFVKKDITVKIFPQTNLCAIIPSDNLLFNDYDNHDQIFADIAYLESRVK